jgi:hypothetical protein
MAEDEPATTAHGTNLDTPSNTKQVFYIMVPRQLLFPKEGGGALRRYLAIRQALLQTKYNDSRPLRGPISLFDFRRHDDAADLRQSLLPNQPRRIFGGWRVSDDGVIGGYSSSHMQFHENNNNHDGDEVGISPSSWSPSTTAASSSSPPFLRWSGTIDTRINPHSQLARGITRSGFAAILSPDYPFGAPLSNQYKALEICCRTDGRTYAVNLHVETYFPEDMYQGFLVGKPSDEEGGDGETNDFIAQKRQLLQQRKQDYGEGTSVVEVDATTTTPTEQQSLDVREHLRNRRNLIRKTYLSADDHPYYGYPPFGFQRYILPFKNFALTSRGRMRRSQRALDGAVNIESIGFTLMDGQDGDFVFDLISLRAVNVLEGEVVGSLEDEAREEEFRNSLRYHPSSSSTGDDEDKERGVNQG